MGLMIDGKWTTQWYEPDEEGRFQRNPTVFHHRVQAQSSAEFAAEAGRYHLYVSLACPWAHRTMIVRRLKGLEDAIGLTVVHPHMADDGWAFAAQDGCAAEPLFGAKFLRDIYVRANSKYTGRVTVPVLWDKKNGTIVNNESQEIIRMLDVEFDGLAQDQRTFYPEKLRERIDATIDALYQPINNGVYRCGFATTQTAYEEAVQELFAALDTYEAMLATQRYLCGDVLTLADWCLFTTLVRFDAVYFGHFKCNVRRIVDYDHLANYLRDLFQVPGVAETCNLHHIKEHYYWSHQGINPTRIVPIGPKLDFAAPHNRHSFG